MKFDPQLEPFVAGMAQFPKMDQVPLATMRDLVRQASTSFPKLDLPMGEIRDVVIDGPGGDLPHFTNFVNAIRDGVPLNQDIEEGRKSVLLCHLGNIACRSQRELQIDPQTGRILRDRDAMRLWGREYRPGWKPRV